MICALMQRMLNPPDLASPTDEQFRLLVESVVDYAMFLMDPSGRIVSWNAGAQRI